MSLVGGLQISSSPDEPALRPDQKRFNTLIRQIAQARETLVGWRDNIALYRQAHVRSVVPLAGELSVARRQWIFALDALLNQPGWSKADGALLRELICDGAGQLLDADDDEDAELKALFDKHGDVDFDTERQQVRETMKQMAEAMTGVDLGDIDGIASDDELLRHMHERLAQQATAAEAAAPRAAPPKRKTAAQQRRDAEAQQATQSVREVFRKLASALHPDRETDPAQRDAKTALMQRVNQAYAGNDLLALLELQLQIEQVDAVHIADAGAQRLKHYNKVLSEQLAELKSEIGRTEIGFRVDFGLEPGWGLNPAQLLGFIGGHVRALRHALDQQRRDLRMLDDRAATKRWLKLERRRLRDEADGGFFY